MEDQNDKTDKTDFYTCLGCATVILAIGLSFAAVIAIMAWAGINAR
jgi:hypothetical protein